MLPKGKVKRGMLPHASAAQEAFEEAGVLGTVSQTSAAVYRQRKASGAGRAREIVVRAFPLEVCVQLPAWPEMCVRKRRWMMIEEAAEAVADVELRSALLRFAQRHRHHG